MTQEIQLDWKGPYRFDRGADQELPQNEPGVYVWTVPTSEGHLITYVGESSAILGRWPNHVHGLLGGYYRVYDPELLRTGDKLSVVYECKDDTTLLTKFTKEIAENAWDNLTTYDWFWAHFTSESRSLRMSVESAILDSVIDKSNGQLVDTRRSVSPENAIRVKCVSRWPNDVRVLGLPEEIEYGNLET